MKNIQGLKKVCIYDPATGDRVLLNYLSPDSTFNKEPIPTETGTGAILGGHSHTVDCIFFDLPDGARDQLESWENDSTEINLVAITGTGVLLWYHPTTLSGFGDSLATNARDGVSPLNFTLEAHGFALDIYYGVNLLRTALKRNEDGKTQYNQAEGFIPLRSNNMGNSRIQLSPLEVETAGTGVAEIFFTIVFPFDVALNVGYEKDSDTSDIILDSLNFAGSIVTTEVITRNENNTFQTGADCYSLAMNYPRGLEWENMYISTVAKEYVNG